MHAVVEYRPITAGHITRIDYKETHKPFNKPTVSSLQKFERKVRRKTAQPAGKHK